MQSSVSTGRRYDSARHVRRPFFWCALGGVAALAMLVRMVFFTGFLGSDELVYANTAAAIAKGKWEASTYVGCLRYGVNIPTALFMKLFGISEFAAGLWAMLCSVGEVALVFTFAHRLWGMRAALLSSALIALLPLHVQLAGSLLADAPLSFFITLSFVLLWMAESRQAAAWYFFAGLAAGCVFWMKELGLMYSAAFAIYAIAYRTWSNKWLWAVLGGALVVAANSVLMWAVQGDPLHIFRIVRGVTDRYVHVFAVETAPWYYLRYLFADARHTWLMPFLALGGMVLWARLALAARVFDRTTGYVVTWALGLLVVYSVLPISLQPLTLVAKQTNYMSVFLAPFCLLAGYFLAVLPRGRMLGLLAAYVAGAVVLSGLEQQAVHVFTANSRGTVAFARGESTASVHGSVNAERAGMYAALLDKTTRGKQFVRPIEDLAIASDAAATASAPSTPKRYAVVDTQTFGWTNNDIIQRLSEVPSCWRRIRQLEPAPGSGLGYHITAAILAVARSLPAPVSGRLVPPFEALAHPKPAYLYEVPRGCVLDTASGSRK